MLMHCFAAIVIKIRILSDTILKLLISFKFLPQYGRQIYSNCMRKVIFPNIYLGLNNTLDNCSSSKFLFMTYRSGASF
jgi:hypothetical protein